MTSQEKFDHWFTEPLSQFRNAAFVAFQVSFALWSVGAFMSPLYWTAVAPIQSDSRRRKLHMCMDLPSTCAPALASRI